jgi:DNA primase
MLVESELDALLICQEAGDLIDVVSLGSASIKPDKATFKILRQTPSILVGLDYDKAGAEAWLWWSEHFDTALRWPVPDKKDVGDYFVSGGDIQAWIIAGLLDAGLLSVQEAEAETQPVSLQGKKPEPTDKNREQAEQLKKELFAILPLS